MNADYQKVNIMVNSCNALLLLANETNKQPLGDIIKKMEEVLYVSNIPEALVTMAKRISKLAELIIMEEAPFSDGCRQLADGLVKMEQSVHTVKDDAVKTNGLAEQKNSTGMNDSEEIAAPAELIELFRKFGQQLSNSLEDFEMYVLEYEKGGEQALLEIKRLLHTWKGEFGVLDIRGHVQLIHAIEDEIMAGGEINADKLLQIKDTLGKAAEIMKKGQMPSQPEKSTNFDTKENILPEFEKVILPVEKAQADLPVTEENGAINTDKGLVADFVNEAYEHIHRAEALLLELEVDPKNMEHINTIFRACHTIKGVAGFLSLNSLTKVSHAIENLIDMIRKGTHALTPSRIDFLFEAMDCLKDMVAAVAGTIQDIPFSEPESVAYIMKQLEIQEKNTQGTAVAVEAGNNSEKKVGELLVENGAASERQISNALRKQKEGDGRPIGEILIDQKVPPKMIGKALAEQAKVKSGSVEIDDTIRVPIKRLDQLIDAIGEGVIAQSMVYANNAVMHIKDISLEKKIAQSMLIMRQIQEMSMSLRMVALRSTFQKMARLVRDLSKKVGKDVEFIMEGEDTELDKSVVENIGDPLIHMLRNSLDHGIETAGERKSSGKSAKARISLRAYHKAGNVCVEIEDDGRGLNREKIRNKAIERGLCKESDNLDDQEIFRFIFMPGFSTATEITDISGRGVGMDVVQRNISALRGAVDIQSEEGKGTLFTIRLPLTLAIINGMVVRLGSERYIVPTLSIVESIRPQKEQIEKVVDKLELLNVRGEMVRLIRLEQLFFGSSNIEKRADTGNVALQVEDAMGRKVALMVDEIVDQQQVVIKNIGEGLGEIPGVSGGAIMSDGTISLILDIAGIVKIAAE